MNSLQIGDLKLNNNIILAPMAGVTDLPFRLLCKKHGCGLVCSEMISAKGIKYGNQNTNVLLKIHPDEKPVSVQLFGSDPDIIASVVQKLDLLDNIAIIDINMGCPMPKIVRNGEGSALMLNPKLAEEIVSKASAATSKPVTVKMRKGFDENNINAVEIAKAVCSGGAKAITVHGRTRTQYYSGTADWDIIRQVKKAVRVPVIGNGDINSPQAAKAMLVETGCDGIMIGRAAQGNPWIFSDIIDYLSNCDHAATCEPNADIAKAKPNGSPEHMNVIKAQTALEHARMLIELKGERTGVCEMRKHLAWYSKGIANASKFRAELTAVKSLSDIDNLVEKIFLCKM